jgi:hypothetical protein
MVSTVPPTHVISIERWGHRNTTENKETVNKNNKESRMRILRKPSVLLLCWFSILLLSRVTMAGTDVPNINRNPPTLEGFEPQNETCLTRNPANSQNIVVAHNDYNGGTLMGADLGICYTTNGGATWSHTHIPNFSPGGWVSSFLFTYDPAVAADTQGNLYATFITDEPNQLQPPVGVFIARSTNQGANWTTSTTPVRYYQLGNWYLDKSWITVDTYSSSSYTDNIYVVWQEDDLNNVPDSDIYLARSSRTTYPTFSTPQPVSTNTFSFADNAPVPAVAPNGDLYVAWVDTDVTQNGLLPSTIRVRQSSNGGSSFTGPLGPNSAATAASFTSVQKYPLGGGTRFRQFSFPSIACDPTNSNNVYVVYAGKDLTTPADNADVFFVRSANRGVTWTTPMVVNDDTGVMAQYQPWIKVKPNGFIDVIFMDGRNDPTGASYDIYMATSMNGGVSFQPNQRVSDQSFDVTGSTGWVGEYLGLDVDSTNAYIAWTDTNFGPTRSGNTPDRDIYFDIMHNPTSNTPAGANISVTVSPSITATFSNVTAAGITTANFVNVTQYAAPAGYQFIPGGSYYGYFDLSTTATYSGYMDIEFKYDPSIVGPNEALLALFHWTGSQWEDITSSVDTANDTVYGTANSLSTFALALPSSSLEPDPLTQGYWHRQCLGAGLITPGRNGRGPQEPTEPDFLKTLVPAVDARLQASIFLPPTFRTCEDGIDAVPPSDPCERALKQYTALLLNIESGRLQESCDIDLSAESCSATTIGDLVNELAGLINSGDPDDCQVASDCAGAVNENQGIVIPAASPIAPSGGSSLSGVGLDIATPAATSDVPSAGTTEDSPQQTSVVDASPATQASEPVSATDNPEVLTADAPTAVDSSAPALVPYISNVGSSVASQVAGEEAIEDAAAEATDTHKTIERHLVVIANASAPARARRTSEDALLTALGGGYEPEVRLEIVRGLLGNVDVAYNSLLIKHLEDIRSEAMEFGNEKAAKEANDLLKRLDPPAESPE